VLLGLEKDAFGISGGGTLFFAERTGLELVVGDPDQVALSQFFSPSRANGSDSDFVVLNGVANSPSHEQWEIVYKRSFRPSISQLREAIDSVEAAQLPVPVPEPEPEPAEPPVLSDPAIEGGSFRFLVQGTPGHTGVVEYSLDGLNWVVLEELNFTDEAVQVVDPLRAGEHRLYRVLSGE